MPRTDHIDAAAPGGADAEPTTSALATVDAAPEPGAPAAPDGGPEPVGPEPVGPEPVGAPEPAPEPVGDPTRMSPRERLAVGLLLMSAFVVILNETVMAVAIPHLMADLAITAGTAQWVTTAFMLTMAVVIPVTGFFLRRVTTRAAFLSAMGLFSLGTLVAALAPGFVTLLVGRIVQASGTAIMMPLLMTTVMTVTPAMRRGRTMGQISVVIAVAPALGPTLSGFVLAALDWRWLFGLVLPIAVAAMVVGAARMPNLNEPTRSRIDVPSVLLATAGFGGLVYGLSQVGESAAHGAVARAWVPLGVGAVALVVFVRRQLRLQRTDAALLDLRTFRSRTFTVALGVMVMAMMTMFGCLILLPLYAQNVLGLDALETGLLLLPGGLLMGLMAPGVGRAYDRFGPRWLVLPGAVLVSIAMWGLTTITPTSSSGYVLGVYTVLAAGLALMFTPLFTSALGSLPPALYSYGSAMVGTVQQVAGAAGTALFVTVMTLRSVALVDDGATETAALADGIHRAFLVGAVLSLLVIPAVLAVRRAAPPAVQEPDAA